MKITLKRTPEQIELVKLMGSNNRQKAIEAQETFAAAIAGVIQNVIQAAPVLTQLFRDIEFDEYTNPMIPLDLYYDVKEKNYIKTWSQTVPGGMASSQTSGATELPVMTYNLTSAVQFLKEYARQGRLDVVAKTLERMAQEILVKQEINAASVVTSACAQATYLKAGVTTPNVIRVNSANNLVIDDFNRLLTMAARINSSWVGGTPVNAPRGLTDLIVSPEVMQEIRAMAYQPMNTVGSLTNIPATEEFRNAVYNSAGLPNIYGVNLIPCYDLGINQAYNTLYGTYAGSTLYPGYAGVGTAVFSPSTEEVVLGIDRTREALIRPIRVDSEGGGTFTVAPDDQFYASRAEKIGFWGRVRQGNVVVDSRAVSTLIV